MEKTILCISLIIMLCVGCFFFGRYSAKDKYVYINTTDYEFINRSIEQLQSIAGDLQQSLEQCLYNTGDLRKQLELLRDVSVRAYAELTEFRKSMDDAFGKDGAE